MIYKRTSFFKFECSFVLNLKSVDSHISAPFVNNVRTFGDAF